MTLLRTLVVLLASAALAGCAGDDDGRLSKTEYEEKVRTVYAEVLASFQRTNVALEELPERVADAQDELRDAADELEGIEPPEDAVAATTQIADGFRLYADELERLRDAAERRDQETIDDFNARLTSRESVRQIAEAAEAMKAKGYQLGQIAEE